MAPPDVKVWLYDISRSCHLIKTFTSSHSIEEYLADEMMKSAVERQLGIIGEALNQMLRDFPHMRDHFADAGKIIAFRNRLIHAYNVISDEIVWTIVQKSLPPLCNKANTLLNEDIRYP